MKGIISDLLTSFLRSVAEGCLLQPYPQGHLTLVSQTDVTVAINNPLKHIAAHILCISRRPPPPLSFSLWLSPRKQFDWHLDMLTAFVLFFFFKVSKTLTAYMDESWGAEFQKLHLKKTWNISPFFSFLFFFEELLVHIKYLSIHELHTNIVAWNNAKSCWLFQCHPWGTVWMEANEISENSSLNRKWY